MDLSTIDQGIATQIGHYADAIVVPAGYDQILISGIPGLDQDGDLAPDIVGQSEQAWENVTRVLDAAGANISNIVFIRQWLTSETDIGDYVAVRTRYITHRPASMLAVIPALTRPTCSRPGLCLTRLGTCLSASTLAEPSDSSYQTTSSNWSATWVKTRRNFDQAGTGFAVRRHDL